MKIIRAKSISLHAAAAPLLAVLHGCAAPDAAPLPGPALAASEQLSLPGEQGARALGSQDSDDLLSVAQGHWLGTCDVIIPGSDQPTFSVEMERLVAPTENPGELTWTIVYRAPGLEQVRPYTMSVSDQAPGRYLLDEHNGILIPHYFFHDGILVSEYQVGNIRLMTRETFHGRKSDFEIIITSVDPELTTNAGEFVVDAFTVSSIQKCSLHYKGPVQG